LIGFNCLPSDTLQAVVDITVVVAGTLTRRR
jgi:hypothetical protein